MCLEEIKKKSQDQQLCTVKKCLYHPEILDCFSKIKVKP